MTNVVRPATSSHNSPSVIMRSPVALKATRLSSAAVVASAAAFGQPAERIVVVHHGLAVGADLQIAFDAVARRDRGGECRGCVLDDAFLIMQPSVRHRPCDQPIEIGHGGASADLENALDLD